MFGSKPWPDPLSIGITTFEARFDAYFVPLLSQLRKFEPHTEIIVAVNGEHLDTFSEQYRSRMMTFLAGHPSVFPIFFPSFRGLAKLWNTVIIHASHRHVLMLNDDIAITSDRFFKDVRRFLTKTEGRSFTINGSWSHFAVNRDEIDRIGYFDERLLGIGEEDGDIVWRYRAAFARPIANLKSPHVANYSEATMGEKPRNIACHGAGKYSRFNREFIYRKKYQPADDGIQGMFDTPMTITDPGSPQYPHERFYRDNVDKL